LVVAYNGGREQVVWCRWWSSKDPLFLRLRFIFLVFGEEFKFSLLVRFTKRKKGREGGERRMMVAREVVVCKRNSILMDLEGFS